MSLQATLRTLEELRQEAQRVRDIASENVKQGIATTSVYDHWAGREAGLADAIQELTRAVRPITREEGWPTLGEQLERDHERHRTVESDLLEDR